MQTIYADGIGSISLIDGVFRLDLITITEIDKEKEKASVHPVGVVAMSPSGLLRSHQQLTETINKLVEQGILKKDFQKAA